MSLRNEFLAATLLIAAISAVVAVPSGHACLPPNDAWPFCNTSMSVAERVAWLVKNLTLPEKLGLIGADPKFDVCAFKELGVPRFGIPPYMWLDETNTGVASACAVDRHCATTFASPTGLAASFNSSVWQRKGEIMSTEQRAMNNLNWERFHPGSGYFIGVNGYGPNLNIVRDPRFGRNHEIPSEDPVLAGQYAVHLVRAMQEGEDPHYIKMIAFLKHFAAYSVETGRSWFGAYISRFDLFDTYLPQFEAGFREGRASGAMCSYAAINGVPSCANDWLLNELMRERWGAQDAVITTDCGAVYNIAFMHHYASNLSDAAAKALNGGTDLNTEDVFSGPNMTLAIATGLTTVEKVNQALTRSMKLRFRAGMFDPLEHQPYTKLGLESIGSAAHRHDNYLAALQSLVLLRNDNNSVLPLKIGTRIALVGPHANSREMLLEQYYGDEVCHVANGSPRSFGCIRSIAEELADVAGAENVQVEEGVGVTSVNPLGIDAALKAVSSSDIAVMVLGNNRDVEKEGHDRITTDLPGIQSYFAQRVLALKVPTVIIFINGGMISFDELVVASNSTRTAIIEAFYPGVEGARALVCSLFACENRWGKLPVTIYPTAFQWQNPLQSFDMSVKPGRTYRYFQGKPLYPFGWGLSLTTFSTVCASLPDYMIGCNVTNTGSRTGDEVVLAFHRVGDDVRRQASANHPVPLKRLLSWQRVTVAPGSTERVVFHVAPSKDFLLTNALGGKALYHGAHHVDVGEPTLFTATYDI